MSTAGNPALGLLAKDDPVVLENVAAAQQADLPVYLAVPEDAPDAIVRVARELGAETVDLSAQEMSPDEISEYLNVHADARSDPGLIIPEDSAVKLDIEASVEAAASESFTTTAVTEPETKDVEVLIGIPAYNEANAIADVVTEAQNYADEVLVVDDASQDETAELARDAGATVVEHGSNKGYGGALKTVFEEADIRDADHLSILDGDGQHDPSDVPAAVRTQKADDVDIVIGSRFVDGSETDLPLYRRVGLTVVNVLTNVSMGVIRRKSWVNDTQSGFRTYNRHAIESLSEDDSIGEEMSASTDILYHAHEHGYDFEEIGTTIDYDVEDPSSHNPVSHGLTLVGNILTTIERKRPILILGVPGFLSSFVGLGFVYWTLSNYISSGTFPLGLATTSGFLILVGIFTCFTAIILHSLNTHLPE
ncbi:glycosyltransferase [Halorubrum sp. CBA1125]|uniref:glycosyltransferase family 2 protein n=1 Tax=Halorubrum sp. CBA1125 TaxID=2668072 RepID=UPI002AA2A3BD|nr:glycosyltransferase [Halorubrum sp. CBA1125]